MGSRTASPAGPPPAGNPKPSAYRWFGAGIASWFGAWGMQMVLFSWLLVGELGTPAEWVGIAQTSTMLPPLGLLLFGGAAADRLDPRRLLVWLHLAAALPALALAVAVYTSSLSLVGLIVYGLCIGTCSAFVMPSRDALLSRVAGNDMMRAVSGMTAVQFGSQALGTLAAGTARWLGSPVLLLAQSLILLMGSFAATRLPARAPLATSGSRGSAWREVADGVSVVARSPQLRVPVLLVLAVGIFFIGPFLVAFPLLVRDFYKGGVYELSLVLMLFPLGTITGSLVLRARGGIGRKGIAIVVALAIGAIVLATIGQGLSFPWMILATFVWGLSGSVFINSSRTLVQLAAPPAQRARVLAVYQLGFVGGGPLGSLAAGVMSGRFGPLITLQVFAVAMLLTVFLVAAASDVSRLE